MNFFRIQSTTINTNPFETKTTNAIRWQVDAIARGATSANLNVTLLFVDQQDQIVEVYFYTLTIPEAVLNVWLDDSVIDDFIVDSSNGMFIKEAQ